MDASARLLVVEDDADIRSALVEYLSFEGYEVAAAADGREGLDRLATGPVPRAVLLDVNMPVLDGFTALREMRQNPAWAAIPVILASADPLAPAHQTERYLHKPFTLDELMSLLDDILAEGRSLPQPAGAALESGRRPTIA
ncbi:MAG TPA: response regulator [Anaeromyxobacteraceae bacterium]|nr:response regulator [Anaeromyxobacteraceae bacterium]